MQKRIAPALFILLAALFFWQCDATITDPKLETVYIINAYLETGKGIDSVFISRNVNVLQPYNYNAAAVTADSVTLYAEGRKFLLQEYTARRGAYFLPADSHLVTPGFHYSLRVYIGSNVISAETLAPDTIAITGLTTDSTYFPYPDPFKATPVRVSWTPAPFAEGYDISVISRTHKQLVLSLIHI